jgi:geranylgeranyl diphosphate synthase, type I
MPAVAASELSPRLTTEHPFGTADLLKVEALMSRYAQAPGSLGESAAYHLKTGGRMLRVRLALAACAAMQVGREQAIGLAAACEFLHNASLVHDDIQDKDIMRRGRVSVWRQYGTNSAITLGDYFLVLAFMTISEIDCAAEKKAALLALFSNRTADVIRGQALDLDTSCCRDLTLADYEVLARRKTAPLLSITVEGALALSGANNDLCAAARKSMSWFGLAYQLRDDILDFCRAKQREDIPSDLRDAKANAVLLYYLERSAFDDSKALADFLARARTSVTRSELRAWADRIVSSDAFTAAVRHFHSACERSREVAEDLPSGLYLVLKHSLNDIANGLKQ